MKLIKLKMKEGICPVCKVPHLKNGYMYGLCSYSCFIHPIGQDIVNRYHENKNKIKR
jgi:hypothetical protein